VIKGFPAWLMHRGYHVLAVPTWERKIRVLAIWLTAALFGRDIVSLASVQHPRQAFITDGELAYPPSGAPADVARDGTPRPGSGTRIVSLWVKIPAIGGFPTPDHGRPDRCGT
jgi:NADH:ubiquinone reductase (H+-translocating)